MEEYSLDMWVAGLNAWGEAFGRDLFQAILYLVAGVIAAHLVFKLFKRLALKNEERAKLITNLGRALYFLILIYAIVSSVHHLGFPLRFLFRSLLVIILVGVALYMTLRPFFPTMPFKIGNTILAAGLFGKVESVSFFHTRLKTFDGKTVFVPNSKILNDILINYHTTPNRRISLDITIRYQDDLDRAMQVMQEVMAGDDRILKKPAPKVYVLGLDGDGVRLGGRCWVVNKQYWKTRCDLFNNLKHRVDAEPRVSFAPSRREVYMIEGPVKDSPNLEEQA
ncbi:hypothetical protein AAU61_13075 [Desulfocarbo indianensis]|nr:hypothetical protein AAU61_13075 [Desulfocarbo indianensis]